MARERASLPELDFAVAYGRIFFCGCDDGPYIAPFPGPVGAGIPEDVAICAGRHALAHIAREGAGVDRNRPALYLDPNGVCAVVRGVEVVVDVHELRVLPLNPAYVRHGLRVAEGK